MEVEAVGAGPDPSALDYEVLGVEPSGPLVDELVGVYRDVYSRESGEFFSAARYRAQLTGHRRAEGWQVALARFGPMIVGYAYGFPLGAATAWWDGLATPVPGGFTEEDGHRSFAVSEVMVRAPWRRLGVARTLVERLLVDRAETRGTLLVEPANAPAQAAYRAWGWAKVAEIRPAWPDAPHFDVLVVSLPLPSTS